MIWATVSSLSYFCWLYRASPSLATKDIINLISVLAIRWCPCVESSLVLLEEGVCYDQCVRLKNSISLCPAHSILQGQICLLLQVFLDFILLPYHDMNGLPWKRTEIILSFLRLHLSTAFQTLLLTVMATPFLPKGFLPTVVDIMITWVKFTHSSLF